MCKVTITTDGIEVVNGAFKVSDSKNKERKV